MPNKNINKNAITALKTTDDSYVQHAIIPEFSLNGENKFTIIAYFYFKSSDLSSELYGQKDIFSFGIKKGCLYVKAPGFIESQVPNSITLIPGNFYTAALRYDYDKVEFFLQGYKIHEAKPVGKVAKSGNKYFIGKGDIGYISTIRVFSNTLEDATIHKETIGELSNKDSCVAWLSFTQMQPVDKSKNKLSISIVDTRAKTINLVACTKFSGKGGALVQNRIQNDISSFTTVGKAYPMFSKNTEMTIVTTKPFDKGYNIILRKQENRIYKLVFQSNVGELVSEKIIEDYRWFDYAITISNNKVTIYIDGELAGNKVMDGIKLDGGPNLLIGTNYDNGSIFYDSGFNGYIDYHVEFETILNIEHIQEYINNPPYMFDENLISSISLNSSQPTDLAYNEPVFLSGDATYTIAESTNPANSPHGIKYFYSTKQDPMWNTLSLEDKWKLTYYVTYINTLLSRIYGFESNINTNDVPFEVANTQRLHALRIEDAPINRRMYDYRPNIDTIAEELEPLLLQRDAAQLIPIQAITNNGFGGTFGARGIVTLTAGTRAMASIFEFLIKIFIATKIFCFIIKLLKEYFYKKPEPVKNKLHIKSICFNNKGNVSNGSLYCRKNQNMKIDPKSVKDDRTGRIPLIGVFVPSKLSETIEFTIEVYCSEGSFTGNLQVENDKLFGSFKSATFAINERETKKLTIYVTSKILKEKPECVAKYTHTLLWSAQKENGASFLINSKITAYTLLDLPLEPWCIGTGDYDIDNLFYVWTDILDICVSAYDKYKKLYTTFSKENSHFACYTTELNENKSFQYDRKTGASSYTTNLTKVKIQKYLNSRNSNEKIFNLNCSDCANLVCITSLASGIKAFMGIMRGGGEPFLCNLIQAIGFSEWDTTFEEVGTFNFHQVCFCCDQDELSYSVPLFDACLKIDNGDYPGSYPNDSKIPLLPTNIIFAETNEPFVNVPTKAEYKEKFYRERLVANGFDCSFLSSKYEVTAFDKEINIIFAKYAEFFDGVRKRLNLTENMLPSYSDYPKALSYPVFQNINRVNSYDLIGDYGYQQEFLVTLNDEENTIDIMKCNDREEAFNMVISALSFVQNPSIEKFYIGDLAFKVTDNWVMFVKNNVVTVINGKSAINLSEELANQL